MTQRGERAKHSRARVLFFSVLTVAIASVGRRVKWERSRRRTLPVRACGYHTVIVIVTGWKITATRTRRRRRRLLRGGGDGDLETA